MLRRVACFAFVLALWLFSPQPAAQAQARPAGPAAPGAYIPAAQEDRPAPGRRPEDIRRLRDMLRESRRQRELSRQQAVEEAPVEQPAAHIEESPPASPAPPAQRNPVSEYTPPPPPQSGPANPPQVEYRNGLLSITALNSTLGDILSRVRQLTGAIVEAPPAAESERVAVRLGPGPAPDVLDELLHGSRFDYIILGSSRRPGVVEQLILRPRGGPPAKGPVVHPRSAYVEPEPLPEAKVGEDLGDDHVPASPAQPDAPPATPQPQPGLSLPGRPIAPMQQPIRSPEEMLRELQRMQQQQQQQQQPAQPRPGPE